MTMTSVKLDILINSVPDSLKGLYRKAHLGLSKATALKVKCLECSCNNREEIRSCPVESCPLWNYRPYQLKGDK